METIVIETEPTADKNVTLLKAVLGNFDFMGPLRGPCLWVEMYNPSGKLFDGAYVRVDGDDWQDWPCNLTAQEDYNYISNIILKKLELEKRHTKPIFITYPETYSFVEGDNYLFHCLVNGYPEDFTFQWFKDETLLNGATGDSYSVLNADLNKTGYYSVVVTNSVGSTTGIGSLI